MELLQLRYFRTVARIENMTRAAQELHIAQPALSKTIARLEGHVGVPLFDRHGGRIRLNTFGKVFLEKVEEALTLLEEGKKEVSDLAGMEHGSIHLATSTLDPLSKPLNAFLSLYPEVNLRITQTSTEEMEHLLESGEIDICFTPLPIDRPGFGLETVLKEDMYLAVPPRHQLADLSSVNLSDVADVPFIGYKEDFIFQKMNDMFFSEAGITPNYVCRVDDPPALASLVRAGLGVALFGCKSGEDSGLTLLPIRSPICQRNFHIIWHEKRYFSLAARRFRDFVAQYFRD
ncbi:LysR family transcriptional regulator [Paenibacillus sp. JCM 10914]|uniref:LysR family transcriptional regulator n=1 Tax=Paenibacillus sp. JCM 10914 TaxID=1236974 RepID=UPI0003CC9598|nr:LysR family transcriptional regulator [Paenibacillus sp. JCM 10914]GAE09774.1 LysR family transcriptional regulator Bsu YybE [Paenibacillus sp. JCM 10914]